MNSLETFNLVLCQNMRLIILFPKLISYALGNFKFNLVSLYMLYN